MGHFSQRWGPGAAVGELGVALEDISTYTAALRHGSLVLRGYSLEWSLET